MNPFKDAARKTSVALDELTAGPGTFPPYAFPVEAAALLAVAAGAFGLYLATGTGLALVRELRRRRRLREKRPDSPSLRGTPTPEELEADGAIVPRTLAVRLRIGSRLADLEPTLDTRLRYRELRNGQKRIKSRAPGLKGWLADRRVTLNYSTLVRYKKLAQRLRQLLALDDRLPLEWLLPGEYAGTGIPTELRAQHSSAKRRLARMLRTYRNFSRLSKHVEAELGISQLLAVRRARRRAERDRRMRRRLEGNARANAAETVTRGQFSVSIAPERLDATKRELMLFLQAPDLSGPQARLRDEAAHWLRTTVGDTRPENGFARDNGGDKEVK